MTDLTDIRLGRKDSTAIFLYSSRACRPTHLNSIRKEEILIPFLGALAVVLA
jgi:hypothetical protein